MQKITIPMHIDGSKLVQLRDIISGLPENDFVWSILFFDGMGVLPGAGGWDDFFKEASAPCGKLMKWDQLKDFSHGLHQTIECSIVAVAAPDNISREEIHKNNFNKCLVVIEAFDSTEWTVLISDEAGLGSSISRMKEKILHSAQIPSAGVNIRGPAQPLN